MEPYIPDKLPLTQGKIDWASHVTLIGKANAALARYDGILQGIVNPQILLSPLMMQEAVISSKIEGTITSLEEVLQFQASPGIAISQDKRDDFQEVINYRQAIGAAIEGMARRPICINLILDLHHILLSEVLRSQDKTPGSLRTTQNYIAIPGAPVEQAAFIPPAPQCVQSALHNWEEYVHADEKDPLVQLAVLKAQFELIHPFRDGNGRIGRMLVPLIMYGKGLLSSPMFYISEYLERNRDIYYERLRAISRNGDWNGWIDFFLKAIVEQADKNTRKAKAILDLYNEMKVRIPEVAHSRFSVQILDAIFDRPFFNSNYFIARSGIPRSTGQRILKLLVEGGILLHIREQSGRTPALLCFPSLLSIAEDL